MSEDWLPTESSQKSENSKLIRSSIAVLLVLGFSIGVYISLSGSAHHQERKPALGEYRFLFESEAIQFNRSSLRSERSNDSSYIYQLELKNRRKPNSS